MAACGWYARMPGGARPWRRAGFLETPLGCAASSRVSPATATELAVTDSRALSLDDLLLSRPLVHAHRTITWGIDERLARFLDRVLRSQHVTLETGSGLSTLVFLRAGVRTHIAVAPDPDEFDVICSFAVANGISVKAFRPVAGVSQTELPRLETPPLDVVLIDGDHAFPAPFVDWHYTADRLVVGGLMIVDDIQLATGAILAEFMLADPKWTLVERVPERFAVFRKLTHPICNGDWMSQPFVLDTHPVGAVRINRRPPTMRERAQRLYPTLPAPGRLLARVLWRMWRSARG